MSSRKKPSLTDRVRRRTPTYTKPGSAPGTLVIRDDAVPSKLDVIAYGPEGYEERELEHVGQAVESLDRFPVVWLNIVGLGSEEVVRSLGTEFGLHRLVLEDIVNTHQRAKVEPYAEALYTVVRMPFVDGPGTEQVSILLTSQIVVTIQEHPGDAFEPVRDRIRVPRGLICERGCDYLLYAIVDAVIDSYFPVLEATGERLDELEEEVMNDATEHTVTQLHQVRRELVSLRRDIWPHRDMLNSLLRDSGDFVTEATGIYLRDAYDHTIQVIDLTDSMRDIAGDLLGTYMSVVSNRMNEVMKVLTIIATVFIPLGFVAGLYGMNFDTSSPYNMPELGWAFGYPAALTLMGAIAFGLLMFFRRKGWLG
ncbi:MAG: magnesium/cobalt transporter CorA [Gemmatimonadota bacterium]